MNLKEIQLQLEELQTLLTQILKEYVGKTTTEETAKKLAFELDALFREYKIVVNFHILLDKDNDKMQIAPADLRTYLIFKSLM
jgi:hypothetical protein